MIGLLIVADFRRDFMRKKNPKANKAFITATISKIRHFYTHFKNQEFKQIFVRGGIICTIFLCSFLKIVNMFGMHLVNAFRRQQDETSSNIYMLTALF